jgi:UDP-glucose 4-epimerase
VDAAREGKPLVVHDDGRQVRCFAHVQDVVGAVLKLMETPAALGRVFNVGSDQPVSILELAERVITLAGSKSKIEFQSYTQAYDKDFEDIRHRVPDLSRLRQIIGYAPHHDLNGIIRDCIGGGLKAPREQVELPAGEE